MFRVLSHLPVYGALATPFPTDGRGEHQEGFVVEFQPSAGDKWLGNFQRGMTSFSNVSYALGDNIAFVITRGTGYRVDVTSKICLQEIGPAIDWCFELSDRPTIIFAHQGLAFEAITKSGRVWHTDRVSWDGFSDLSYEADKIVGKAYSPLDGRYHRFEVNISDGSFIGGSYNGPRMSFD